MARTKEVITLNLNHAHNVYFRNGRIALSVQDPKEKDRIIFVEIGCDTQELASNMLEKFESAKVAIERAKLEKKINTLKSIVDNEDFSEDMRHNAKLELEDMGVSV